MHVRNWKLIADSPPSKSKRSVLAPTTLLTPHKTNSTIQIYHTTEEFAGGHKSFDDLVKDVNSGLLICMMSNWRGVKLLLWITWRITINAETGCPCAYFRFREGVNRDCSLSGLTRMRIPGKLVARTDDGTEYHSLHHGWNLRGICRLMQSQPESHFISNSIPSRCR